MTGNVGTPRWMAPELLRNEPYSTASDVFSFGMVRLQKYINRRLYTNWLQGIFPTKNSLLYGM